MKNIEMRSGKIYELTLTGKQMKESYIVHDTHSLNGAISSFRSRSPIFNYKLEPTNYIDKIIDDILG